MADMGALNPAPSGGRDVRKQVRFLIDDASTSFSIKGISTSLGSGRANRSRAAINLSEGGTMLLLCEPLPVGTEIHVRIEIDGYEESIQAGGVVRWCEQEGRNDREFRAGVEFVDLGPEQMRKIARMRDWTTSPEYRKRAGTPRAE
jgi:hypothetical protein